MSAAALCSSAQAATQRIIAFGDSLSAGYLLPADAAFPAVLEKALRAKGLDVEVANAAVSGDTASGGLERLDWAINEGADLVILELGGNDMLRGTDPKVTQAALDAILTRLAAKKMPVLIAGMQATPSLGKDYKVAFDAIYPALATKFKQPLYPFFLEGVATERGLLLTDGIHPTKDGVAKIVQGILPSVEAALKQPKPQD